MLNDGHVSDLCQQVAKHDRQIARAQEIRKKVVTKIRDKIRLRSPSLEEEDPLEQEPKAPIGEIGPNALRQDTGRDQDNGEFAKVGPDSVILQTL